MGQPRRPVPRPPASSVNQRVDPIGVRPLITADIWFRCFGTRPRTGYLTDGRLVTLTTGGTVPVDEHLNVQGHEHVYALGDIADLADAKMATHAQTQALVVAENTRAQLKGEHPEAVYQPAPVPRIFLPLGTRGGVGQLPMPDGTAAQAPLETVIQRKGADLFTAASRNGSTGMVRQAGLDAGPQMST